MVLLKGVSEDSERETEAGKTGKREEEEGEEIKALNVMIHE